MPLKDGYFYPVVQTATNDLVTNQELAATVGNGGGAGPVKQLTADYTFPGASENGYTYANDGGNSGTITITVPAGLANGTAIRIIQSNTNASSNTLKLSFSGGENVFYSIVNGATIATGNVGGTCTVVKVNAVFWFVVAAAGNVQNPV